MFDEVSNTKLITLLVFCFLVGSLVLFLTIVTKVKSSKYENWPQVEGVIISSDVGSGPAEHRGSTVRSGGYSWNFKVEYEYSVDDVLFRSNKLTSKHEYVQFYQSDGDVNAVMPDELIKLKEDFPAGKRISVSVSPKNPKYAYLIYDSSNFGVITAFFFSLGFLGLGYVFLRAYLAR